MEYIKHWITNPLGGELFTGQRDGILEHPQDCKSLKWVWLPRRGGFTGFGETETCHGCDLVFYNEGIYEEHWEEDDVTLDYIWYFCECCSRER